MVGSVFSGGSLCSVLGGGDRDRGVGGVCVCDSGLFGTRRCYGLGRGVFSLG